MSPRNLTLALLVLAASSAGAQPVVELRGSSTKYRFADYSRVYPSRVVADVLYLGAPGADELYLGMGYQWQAARGLVATPIAYAVVGKQNRELGFCLGGLVSLEKRGWKGVAFVGHFFHVAGDVPDYSFLDTLDITRALGRWEVGLSGGFLHQGEDWNPLLGPVLKRNDARGSWALSVRGGYRSDVRLVRILTF